MDSIMKALVDYALDQNYATLSQKTIHEAVRHHLDGVGCAAGGFKSEPCQILRNLAARAPMKDGVTAYGVHERTIPEYAVMANASTNRHLDFNDTGIFPGSGSHPNDMTPAIVAAVEMMGGTGKDLIFGTCLGYEVSAAMGFAFDFRVNGWDQGTQIGVATAVAVSRLFGLDREKMANAIALTLMPGSPLRVVRTGDLSHWKGCATAQAAMHAFFSTQLARDGMTGPSLIFEGTDGFWKQISRGPFTMDHIGKTQYGLTAMERTFFKYFPSEYNSQGLIATLLTIRDRFRVEDIASIDIATYWMAWHEIGGGQGDAEEKWNPQTREGADHSMPFLVAAALTDGKITLNTFETKRVRDPALRPLMNKIKVTCEDEFEDRFQKTSETGARIKITLKDGTTLVEEAWHPKGSSRNPMTDDEVNVKFDNMVDRVLSASEGRKLRDMLWNLEKLKTLDELTANFRSWKSQ